MCTVGNVLKLRKKEINRNFAIYAAVYKKKNNCWDRG